MSSENPRLVAALAPNDAVVVLCGHYGVGKTNLAINLALATCAAGFATTLVDMDLVNPYFRSSDYNETVESRGVSLIAPVFARTSLDTPSIDGRLAVALETAANDPKGRRLIIDVGGDDAGATALRRFTDSPALAKARMLYVVNAYRNLTHDPKNAVAVLREIEGACGIAARGIVNVSHLAEETTALNVAEGHAWALEVARTSGLDLVATLAPTLARPSIEEARAADPAWSELADGIIYIDRHVLTPWQ